MRVEEILNKEEKYRYQLLDRMRMDCDFFLGNGRIYGNHLWAGNVVEQIWYMKSIWCSFPENAKPQWLTWEQILHYEKQLTTQRIELHPTEAFMMMLKEKSGFKNATIGNTHIYRYYSDYWIVTKEDAFTYHCLKLELPGLKLQLKE